MFKRELDLGGSFQLTVDSNVAKENISRFCNTKGVKYELVEEGEEYTFKVGS
jgi:TusA-related sulfurtransferase